MIDQAAHYTGLYEKYGSGAKAAGWGSYDTQQARLRALASLVSWGTILDVGCGSGVLLDFLSFEKGRSSKVKRYEGWDVCLPALERAIRIRQWSGCRFVHNDILSTEEQFAPLVGIQGEQGKYDYVLASGLFTHGNMAFFLAALARMWELCTRVCAFNFLTTWGDKPVEGEFRADPIGVVTACRQLPGMTGKLVLRTDYLGPYDATVALFR